MGTCELWRLGLADGELNPYSELQAYTAWDHGSMHGPENKTPFAKHHGQKKKMLKHKDKGTFPLRLLISHGPMVSAHKGASQTGSRGQDSPFLSSH